MNHKTHRLFQALCIAFLCTQLAACGTLIDIALLPVTLLSDLFL